MQPTREDILIGRVTDGEASPADWAELETMAHADASVWTRLASGQRAQADLARAVDDELTIAELVQAPAHEAARGGMTPVALRWRAYSGWAAAATLALAWAGANGLGLKLPLRGPNGSGVVQAGLGPDELLSKYIDAGKQQGRVLGELPMVMVETTPVPGAAPGAPNVEVVYVRRVLERAVVNDLYRVGRDEHGDPAPVQVNVAALRAGRTL